MADKMSALDEAKKLVHGDRQADYGHPARDFATITEILNALGFRRMDARGKLRELKPTDHPIIMQAVKLSREYHRPKRDNRVDGAGYWETLQMVHDYEGNE